MHSIWCDINAHTQYTHTVQPQTVYYYHSKWSRASKPCSRCRTNRAVLPWSVAGQTMVWWWDCVTATICDSLRDHAYPHRVARSICRDASAQHLIQKLKWMNLFVVLIALKLPPAKRTKPFSFLATTKYNYSTCTAPWLLLLLPVHRYFNSHTISAICALTLFRLIRAFHSRARSECLAGAGASGENDPMCTSDSSFNANWHL